MIKAKKPSPLKRKLENIVKKLQITKKIYVAI
jgi:hypothetical protein